MATESPTTARIPPAFKAKLSPKALEIIEKVYQWVETECTPAEPIMKSQLAQVGKRWVQPPLMTELRKKAKDQGLFNLFLPHHFVESPGLTNLEYACCAKIMGRVYWAAEVKEPLQSTKQVDPSELTVSVDDELPRTRNWKYRAYGQVLHRRAKEKVAKAMHGRYCYIVVFYDRTRCCIVRCN